MVKHETIEKKY